jgi:hypothetical protein
MPFSLEIDSRIGSVQGGELLAEVGPQTTSYVWVGGELLGIARSEQFYASHNDQVGDLRCSPTSPRQWSGGRKMPRLTGAALSLTRSAD